MIATLVALALVTAAGCWWWIRRLNARDSASRAPRVTKRFAAVEIRPRNDACEAAHALEGQRFLSNQAPALPLEGCSATQCGCRFVKLSDRRDEERRLGHEGLKASMFLNADRRNQTGRRDAD
jgi:hypothetical protein